MSAHYILALCVFELCTAVLDLHNESLCVLLQEELNCVCVSKCLKKNLRRSATKHSEIRFREGRV